MNTALLSLAPRWRTLLALAAGGILTGALPAASSPFEGRRVLVIGIDGCRPDALRVAEAPHLHGLIKKGVVSWEAVAGGEKGTASLQATSSGPGWSSILTGVWRDQHGVSNNDFTGDRFDAYPHFFRRVKEVEPEAYLSSIVSWNPIDSAIVGPVAAFTDFRGKGQGATYGVRDVWVRDTAVAHLTDEDPDVLFLHFDQVDGAGHASGFDPGNPAYLDAIARVDALIGSVLEAIEARPARASEQWLVIVTTDHGGQGTSHGGQSDDERTIFFLVSGDSTARLVSSQKPGHTAVPGTVFEYLGLPVSAAWKWEERGFGLPPYPPSEFRVERGVGDDILLRWRAPVGIASGSLVVKRNGRLLAELPLTETQYVDRIPPGFLALQLVYTLEVSGPFAPDEVLTETLPLPRPLNDKRVAHWPLDGDVSDLSGNGHDGTLSGAFTSVAGAFGGEGLQLGEEGLAGAAELPPSELLTFDRFTGFSAGIWLRPRSAQEGSFLTGANGDWSLSLRPNGSLRFAMGSGEGRVILETEPSAFPVDTWHHVGVSMARPGETRLYVDGEEADRAESASPGETGAFGPIILRNGTDAAGEVALQIDDFQVWRRPLTASEWGELVQTRAGADTWRRSRFDLEERLDPGTGAWLADPDHDGRSNLEEYALLSDPRLPDESVLLAERTGEGMALLYWQSTGGRGDPAGAYRVRGVTARLETTLDLQASSWETVADHGAMTGIEYGPDGRHRVRWMPHSPLNGARYYRIRYTLEPDEG